MKNTLALVLMVFGIVSTPLTAEVKSFMCGMNLLFGGSTSTEQLMIPDSEIQYSFLLQIEASNKLVNWRGRKLQNYTENSSEVIANNQPKDVDEEGTMYRTKTEIIFNKFNGNLREGIFYEIKSSMGYEPVWVESSFTKYLCKKTESLL